MITYAQNFEDAMLARLFGGRVTGFYVDVGAGDPAYLSVTKWFYDLGWSGINIEPHVALHQRLIAERPRDVNLAIGAGAARGEAEFLEFAVKELSSFDARIRKHARDAGIPYKSRTVSILPLSDILEQYGRNRNIDFLKIDAEGWEREVLSGLDLQRYRPTVIVIEATFPETRTETHSEWDELLVHSNYSFVYFDGLNRFYLAKESIGLRRHFDLPPNLFDDIKSAQLAAMETAMAVKDAEADYLRNTIALRDEEANRFKEAIALRDEAANRFKEAIALRDEAANRFKEAIALRDEEANRFKEAIALRDEEANRFKEAIALMAETVNLRRVRHGLPAEEGYTKQSALRTLAEAIRILRSPKAMLRHFFLFNVVGIRNRVDRRRQNRK